MTQIIAISTFVYILGIFAMYGFTARKYKRERYPYGLDIHWFDRLVVALFWPLGFAFYLGACFR